MFNDVLCRICLRANVGARDIPGYLIELHDEICEYNINENKWLKYCAICEHLLRKFYEFRKRCRLANKELMMWNSNQKTVVPGVLHEKLPDFPIGINNNMERRKIYDYVYNEPDLNPDLDLESDLSLIIKETAESTLIIKDTKPKKIINIDELLQNNESFDNFESVIEYEDCKEDMVHVPEDDLNPNQNDFISYVSHTGEVNGCNTDGDSYNIPDKNNKKVRTKAKKITKKKYKKLAELSEEDRKIVRLDKARQKFLKNKAKLKEKIMRAFDTGLLDDLGDEKITKEMFSTVFEKYDNMYDGRVVSLKPGLPILPERLKKFVIYLYRKYNPEYAKVFDIEYLNTDEKKLQEFNRRKEGCLYKEAPFKCELCYKGFMAQSFLDYHNKWHNVEPTPNDIVCNICPMRFVSKSTYKAHRKNNHTVVYTCRQCPVVTYHFSVMFNHYNQHKGVEHQCPVCLSVFSNLTTLNSHQLMAHATSHICTACARSFVSEKGLFLHKKHKHKDETQANPAEAVLCAECNITFDSRAVYQRHARTAHTRHRAEIYKCYYCKDRFSSIEELREHKLEFNHQRAHRDEQKAEWVGHRKVKRVPVTEPYRKCEVCHAEVPNTYSNILYRHYLKAHPNVPYTQNIFSKNYLCEQCGKTFVIFSYFQDHKNVHTGAKPYVCKKCPARFSSRVKLKFHSERHRPPRYQCKQCGKLFLSPANLFAHRRIHIGDRRFKCEVCSKGFLHASSLTAHINGVHNQIRRVRKPRSKDKNLQ